MVKLLNFRTCQYQVSEFSRANMNKKIDLTQFFQS